MKLAYLASQITIPGAPNRRVDAFEHDLMMDSLRCASGVHVTDIAWDDEVDWAKFDAALIGTTWDYQDRFDEFITRLTHIQSQSFLFNPLPLIRWNAHKGYLRDLENRGAAVIPSLWLDVPMPADIERAFAIFQCDALVAKRQIGASAEGQYLFQKGTPLGKLTQPMLIQPFFPAIQTEGEISFIFIGGRFSHAVLKRPAQGDYRIQSAYGGHEQEMDPSPLDKDAAHAIFDLIEGEPLYARIDMVRDGNGQLRVMEVELIEPYLYPEQCPQLGQRLIHAIEKAI